MRVFWTDRAKQRLRELHDYVAQEAPLVALQIVKRLVRRSRQLQRSRHGPVGEFPNTIAMTYGS